MVAAVGECDIGGALVSSAATTQATALQGVVLQQVLVLMQVAIDKKKTSDVCHQQNRLHPRGGAGRRFAAFDKTASREHISGASLALARQRATPTSRFCSWAV